MAKFSVAMIAAVAAACGGGGKKTDTAKPEPGGRDETGATDTATQVSTETKPAEPEKPQPPRKVLKSIKADQLEWKPLVAEAGDKGPMVASLWGDMMSEPNGFMIKLPAGDKGMLHTHTNDYHAVGVTASGFAQDGGKVHPVAAGTYWTQPGGVAHIDTCPGTTPCIGFVHYNAGKFDFAPAKPAKGARPDPRGVEKTLKAAKWVLFDEKNPKAGAWSALWGDMKAGANGMYIKLPAGNSAFWHIHANDHHGVVLAGTLDHHESGTEPDELPTGSYWWQPGGNKHVDLCKAGGPDCVVYVYFESAYDVKPAE